MSISEDQLRIVDPLSAYPPLPTITKKTLHPTEDVYASQGRNPPPYLPLPLGTYPVPLDSEVQRSKETDIEGLPVVKEFVFDNPSIRRGFMRKVYSIVTVQLAITLSFVCWFQYDKTTRQFVREEPIILFVSIILVIIFLIFMSCWREVHRRKPMNYIILVLFTLAESVMLSAFNAMYDSDYTVLAVGVTAIVCFGLTLFSFQTIYDFTICKGFLFISLLVLIVFSISISFIPSKTNSFVYAFLGALLFSVYLVYESQKIMGADHKYSISPEEYVFVATNQYLDIINILLIYRILRMIEKACDKA